MKKKVILGALLGFSELFANTLSLEVLDRLCSQGNANYCMKAGKVRLERFIPQEKIIRECDAGDIGMCRKGGFLALNSKPKNFKSGLRFYEKGCEAGDLLSCENVGVLKRLALDLN